MTEEDWDDERVAVVLSQPLDAEEMQLSAEALATERERVIQRLIELYPAVAEDVVLMESLRGETNARLVDLPARLSELAPLIARAYALLDREMKMRPEAFRPNRDPTEPPNRH